MRDDWAKVVCERPRYKERWFTKGERYMRQKNGKMIRRVLVDEIDDADDVQDDALLTERGTTYDARDRRTHAPMSRFAKELTDHIQPLRRWAAKQVGRPYDLVMSEIHKVLGGNGVLQRHVLDHLHQYIIRPEKVAIIDGKPYHKRKYQRREDPPSPIDMSELYGDPRDGIVKRGPTKLNHMRGPASDSIQRQLRTLPHPPRHGQRIEVDAEYNTRWAYGKYLVYDHNERSWVLHYDHDTSWNTWEGRQIEAVEHVSQPVGPKRLRALGFKTDTRRKPGRAGRRRNRQ